MLTINYKLSTHPRLLEFLETMKGQDATIIITEDHEYLESKKPKGMYQQLRDQERHVYNLNSSQSSNTVGSTTRGNLSNSTFTSSNSSESINNLAEAWIAGADRSQLERAALELDRQTASMWGARGHSSEFGEFSTTDARTVNENSPEGGTEEIRYSRRAHRLEASNNGVTLGSNGTITVTPSNTTSWIAGSDGTYMSEGGAGRTYITGRNLVDSSITNPSTPLTVTGSNNSFVAVDPLER